jgi:hypothetical protein
MDTLRIHLSVHLFKVGSNFLVGFNALIGQMYELMEAILTIMEESAGNDLYHSIL